MLVSGLRSLLLTVLLAGATRAAGASDPSLISWEELQAESSRVTEAINRHLGELQEAQNEKSTAEEELLKASITVDLIEGIKDYMAGTKSVHDEYASEIGETKAAVEALRAALKDPELPREVQSLAARAEALERVYAAAASEWTTWWSGPGKRHKAAEDLEAAEREAERCRKHVKTMQSRLSDAEERLNNAEYNVQVVTELMEPHAFVADDANFQELKDALGRADAKLSPDQLRAVSAAVDFFRPADDPHLAAITEEIASETPGAKYAGEIIDNVTRLRGLTQDNIVEYITRYQDIVDALEGDESQMGSIKQLEAALEAAKAASTSAKRKLASLKAKAIPAGPEAATDRALGGDLTAPEAAEEALKTALNKPEIKEAISAKPTLRTAAKECITHMIRRNLLADAIKSPETLNDPKFARDLALGRQELRETEAKVEKAKKAIETIESQLQSVRDQKQTISVRVAERQVNTAALAAVAGL